MFQFVAALRPIHHGVRRDKLVRGLFQSINDIEHALASLVLDTTLLIALAILLLYLVILRGLSARNSTSVIVPTVCLYACAADRPIPLPRPLLPHEHRLGRESLRRATPRSSNVPSRRARLQLKGSSAQPRRGRFFRSCGGTP